MKKIIFLTPIAEKGASSRYRVYQYIEYLRDAYKCEVFPFMTNEIYTKFKEGKKLSIILQLPFLLLKRIYTILFKIHRNDTVFLHRDILPFRTNDYGKNIKIKRCEINI